MNIVIKRTGEKDKYDYKKIKTAIRKANEDINANLRMNENDIDEVVAEINTAINNKEADKISVEEIQDIVEEELMDYGAFDVARAYIRYRYKQEVAREKRDDFIHAIKEKLSGEKNDKQNANVDEESFGGRTGEATRVVTKQLAIEDLLSPMARANHLNNEIYIHDLDNYFVGSHNCLSIPFDDLLKNGVKVRQTDLRPANSVNTAFQLVAVIFQLQSLCQFGGVSATHLDWTMVPYVRKSFRKHYIDGLKYIENIFDQELFEHIPTDAGINDEEYKIYPKVYKYAMDMTEKEVYQGVEALYHNLNTLQSRSGNQLPFTSINYGTCTLPEGRMVIKALLDNSIKGLGKLHRTSIFPCGIFQLGKGINRKPGDPNYDLYLLALKSTAQRLYPNYANIDWSGNAGYDVNDPTTFFSTMGCRTANGWDINGLGQQKDGRGNICPVTIILPTLAMEAREAALKNSEPFTECLEGLAVDNFLKLLDKKIHEAKDMLIERFNWICSQSPESAKFMWENNTMAGYIPEEGIRSAMKHGTLAMGNLGLAECLQILVGDDHTSPEGMEIAKQIYQLFKDRCAQFKEQYKLNFGVYNTPAENLCFTAMTKFKQKYGEIPNVSDKKFFTNSIHVPVWKQFSPFEKIDIESQLTGYSSAGCITYVELDSGAKNNIPALETIVNYAMDKDIPYFAINVPNDTCLDCGYCDEFNDSCPECGSHHIQQLRRVTGYLTSDYKTSFNEGKQQEVEMRYKHGRMMK